MRRETSVSRGRIRRSRTCTTAGTSSARPDPDVDQQHAVPADRGRGCRCCERCPVSKASTTRTRQQDRGRPAGPAVAQPAARDHRLPRQQQHDREARRPRAARRRATPGRCRPGTRRTRSAPPAAAGRAARGSSGDRPHPTVRPSNTRAHSVRADTTWRVWGLVGAEVNNLQSAPHGSSIRATPGTRGTRGRGIRAAPNQGCGEVSRWTSARAGGDAGHLGPGVHLAAAPGRPPRRTSRSCASSRSQPAKSVIGRPLPSSSSIDGARSRRGARGSVGSVGEQVRDGLGGVGLGVPDQPDRAALAPSRWRRARAAASPSRSSTRPPSFGSTSRCGSNGRSSIASER